MDYEVINKTLGENLVSLITWGGSINPILGAGIALVGAAALIYFGWKAGKQLFQKTKKKAGELISGTGKDQNIVKKIKAGINNFLDGKK